MKFLQKIFAKKHVKPHVPSLAEQLVQLDSLSQFELESLVRKPSTHLELRIQALQKIDNTQTLKELAWGHQVQAVEKNARQQLAQALDNKRISLDSLRGQNIDTNQLLTLVPHSQQADLQQQIIGDVTDQQQLLDLCIQASSSLARQQLVARISDVNALKTLVKHLKNKDKTSYKRVKSRLDAIKQEQVKVQSLQARAQQLCEDMQLHAKRVVDHKYAAETDRLSRRWQELEACYTHDLSSSFMQALAQCQLRQEALQEQPPALIQEESLESSVDLVDEQTDVNSAAIEAQQALFAQLWEKLVEICDSSLGEARITIDANQWQEALNQLETAFEALDSTQDIQTEFNTLMAVARELFVLHTELGALGVSVQQALAQVGEDLSESDNTVLSKLYNTVKPLVRLGRSPRLSEAPKLALLSELENWQHAQKQLKAAQKKQRDGIIANVSAHVRRAKHACHEGHLRRASGIRHAIDDLLESLVGDVPSHLVRQIDDLDVAIQKLVDWQNYAVVPKKEALVESMKQLVGIDMPADALATKIKSLQDEWKQLRQSGRSADENLWQKFKSYGDSAYEPCREYFDHLATKRAENLQVRKELLEQLQQFVELYHWHDAVWKDVEKILRTAKTEFHAVTPVERSANKPIAEAFAETCRDVQNRIDDAYAANKAEKQQIVFQAEKLLELHDSDKAIDTAKRLQAQWKTLGPCHHRDNEHLWKAFRGHCDAVFERKSAQRTKAREAIDAHIAHAREPLDKLKKLLDLTGEQLLAERDVRREYEERFKVLVTEQDDTGVDKVPEKVLRAMQKDLANITDRLDAKVEQYLQEKSAQQWHGFFDICERLNQWQFALATDPSDKDRCLADLQLALQEHESLPFAASMFEAVLTSQGAGADKGAARQLLCVRAEILADMESPATDKNVRMQYQVSQLSQGLGQVSAVSKVDAAHDLAEAWLHAAACETNTYAIYAERFQQAWFALR